MTADNNLRDSEESDVHQQQRLRQFLFWLMVLAFGFAVFYGIVLLITPNATIAAAGVLVLCFSAAVMVAWRLTGRGQLMQAVVVTCAAFLSLAIAFTAVIPDLYDVFLLVIIITVALALPYLQGRALRRLSAASMITALIVAALGELTRFFTPPPEFFLRIINVGGLFFGVGLVLLLLWQYSTRLTRTLEESRRTNSALQSIQSQLEERVAERTVSLQTALNELGAQSDAQQQLLQEIEQQRATIRGLSMPVLPVSASTLVIPLVGELDERRLTDLRTLALQALSSSRARSLVLDVTGVPFVDGQVAHGLLGVIQAARLLGSRAVLVGITPGVAESLVQGGTSLAEVATFRDLQSALADESFLMEKERS